jgi:HEAT repeat protein
VKFLRDQLRPAETADCKNIDQLVKGLDDVDFSVRQQATKDLEKLESMAQSPLENALASKPSAEVKRRVETLLAKISNPVNSPDKLQALRAIEVLEHIATPEAQQVLKTLSEGAPEARVTREAKASLERLAKRARNSP